MKKTIWIFNHYATDMFVNKGGRHYWFAKELKKRGYNVSVFCASTLINGEPVDIGSKKYQIKTDEEMGIPFIHIKTKPSSGNGIDRIRNMTDFYFNLKHVINKVKRDIDYPNVIIASSVHPLTMIAGIQIAKKMKVPCICEIRDLWPEAIFSYKPQIEHSIVGKLLIKGEHWIYKKADALIFTKEGDTDYLGEKKWLVSQGGDIDKDKCNYINNGIDIEQFDKQISLNIIDDDDLNNEKTFKVIYTGTLRPINNVGNILDCAKLFDKTSNIEFIVYGDGNQYGELESRINEEKITNVHLKGRVNKKYIPYILSKADINLLNYSNNYNWTRGNSSNKLFEYMASGKPIIATVQMGYSIINKYKCGTELAEYKVQSLADAILEYKKMPQNEYQDYCRNSRQGAYEFDFKKLTDKLESVINEFI